MISPFVGFFLYGNPSLDGMSNILMLSASTDFPTNTLTERMKNITS